MIHSLLCVVLRLWHMQSMFQNISVLLLLPAWVTNVKEVQVHVLNDSTPTCGKSWLSHLANLQIRCHTWVHTPNSWVIVICLSTKKQQQLWESHYHNSNLLEWSADYIYYDYYRCLHTPCYFNVSNPNCMLSMCAHGKITTKICSVHHIFKLYTCSAYANA